MKDSAQKFRSIARAVAADLKAQLRGTAVRTRRPAKVFRSTNTEGWWARIGGLGQFGLDIWFDRSSGHSGRRLWAGLYAGGPLQLASLCKKIEPARIVTEGSFDGGFLPPLAKTQFGKPIYEDYGAHTFFGLYSDRPGLVASAVLEFTKRTAKFLKTIDASSPAEKPSDGSYKPGQGDDRDTVIREIKARQGQGNFRGNLIVRYGGKCQISGCETRPLLDACHICAYRQQKDNHFQNGLLLRTDLHTLFDLGLLWIESTSMRVRVAESVTDPAYRKFDGTKLRVDDENAPSPLALKRHFERVAQKEQ